jgi:hypothetical protein
MLPRIISTHPTYACSRGTAPYRQHVLSNVLGISYVDDKGMPWTLIHATRTSPSSTRHTHNNGPIRRLRRGRPIAAV